MGVIYRAVDLVLDRPVAIKTLRVPSVEASDCLRREGQALAAVDHPNLAQVFDLLSCREGPYLVLELMAGGTLEDRLREGAPLAPVDLLSVAIGVGEALSCLHHHDLVHRDVKPSNIGFAHDATPKLFDLGLSRSSFDQHPCRPPAGSGPSARRTSAIGIDERKSTSNTLLGTLHYMSPEVLGGGPRDHRLDLWALGVVLWEAAAGRHLYWGASFRDVARQIRLGHSARLATEAPHLPRPLACVLDRVLQPDEAQRPHSAEEMVAWIEEAGRAAGLWPPGAGVPPHLVRRRRRPCPVPALDTRRVPPV